MSPGEGPGEPLRQRKRDALLAGFLISSVVVTLVAVVGAFWLSPPVLALVMLPVLGLVWYALYSLRPRLAAYPQWYDTLPCYLSVQDRRLRIIDTNERFRRAFGDRIGEYCYRVYKGRDEPCSPCPVLKTFETGEIHTGEQNVQLGEGQSADVIITSSPLYRNGGRPKAVVEMFTNVSEIRELSQELAQSRQDFRRLFDLVPCYISIQDEQYRVLETNALFREDFGTGKGRKCYEAYKGNDHICPGCPVEQTFADGQMHTGEETVVTCRGDEENVAVYSMPIREEGGRVSAVMEVSTNVTEVKRLQTLATVGLAVTGMAHRIKNILMGLKGGVYVVNTGFETDDEATVDEGWGMVQRNVDKVAKVTADLLFCSKDRQPALEEDVCPTEIVREVHELFVSSAAAENIDIRLETDMTAHCGRFDPEALHNLVTNLVANAVDACRFDLDGGDKEHRITLRCFENDDHAIVIEVEDNGAGIPDELAEKVFDGFFSTKGTEGTGLGLLVVQKVAEEHAGSVDFDTEEGRGTTFSVVLPRGGADLPRADEPPLPSRDPESLELNARSARSEP